MCVWEMVDYFCSPEKFQVSDKSWKWKWKWLLIVIVIVWLKRSTIFATNDSIVHDDEQIKAHKGKESCHRFDLNF